LHSPMKTRVVVADARKIYREGICALLERHTDIKLVGEADLGQAAVKLAAAMTPDVAVLNVSASTHGLPDLIRELRAAHPPIRVIVLTLSPNASFVREILGAGAAGCLTKDCASGDLVTAIRTVMTHKVYLGPGTVELVIHGYVLPADRKAKKPRALSPRETVILRQIADGQSTKEIAARFGVSSKTIETHRRRIMQKLGRHTVAGLTKYAVQEGITSFE
jgi:DNA-binding NarL/FixJ family response regulator